MAGGGTQAPSQDIGDAVDEFLHFVRRPLGTGNLGSGLETAIRPAVQAATQEAVAAEGSEVGALADAIAEVLFDSVAWIVILAAASFIVLCKIVEQVFYKLADFPLMPFKDQYRALIHQVFSPVNQTEQWVGRRLADVITSTIVNVIHAFRAFWQYEVGNPTPIKGSVTQAEITRLQSEINATNHRVDQVNNRITQLEQQGLGTTVLQPVPTPVPAPAPQPSPITSPSQVPGLIPLEHRVTRLEEHMASAFHNLNVLHGDIVRLSRNSNVTEAQITRLTNALNGVRAEQFGMQDVLTEVYNGIQYVEYEVGQILPQLDSHARTLHILSPLQSLLYLGQPGLKVLQRLERNPCQCPGLPQLPGDQAALLAAYEFLTHG